MVGLAIALPKLRGIVRADAASSESALADAFRPGRAIAPDAPRAELPAGNEGAPRPATIEGMVVRHDLPTEQFDVEQLHRESQANKCDALPAESPINLTSFIPFAPDEHRAGVRRPGMLSSRRSILTIGMDMTRQDRRDLPTLSGGEILDFLASQYVVIQVRVLKDPATGEEFLDHRPLGAIVSFSQPAMSMAPQPALTHSLQQYRGVGLFVPDGESEVPENLRTLVLLNRTERATSSTGDETSPHYEYVFVRGRMSHQRPAGELQLYAFATTDDRTRLHLLHSRVSPRRPRDCTVTTFVRFTKYSYAGLLPEASVTRAARSAVKRSYSLSQLDDYSQHRGWGDSAFDRLTEMLDAIIEGDVDGNIADMPTEPAK